MAKREPDKLALDMMQCKADGYGCRYGKWKALQKEGRIEHKLPENWRVCPRCGHQFKPKAKTQKYCEYACQRADAEERRKAKHLETMRRYRERKKAGANI
jgi:hypothetical protein